MPSTYSGILLKTIYNAKTTFITLPRNFETITEENTGYTS